MALKIHAAYDEGPPDKERSSGVLIINGVSSIASSLPSVHLDMWEIFFSSIGKVLVLLRGRTDGVYQIQGSC